MHWMILLAGAASVASAQPPASPRQSETGHAGHGDMAVPKTATILPGYGAGGFPITTRVPRAQAFFDNGMQLAHAFAHDASIKAMDEAVRLDPGCAMCLWGLAWVSGPTINYGKSGDELAPLARMADKAAELAATGGTERERALIKALQRRYKDGGGGKPGDLAFAKSMAALASTYPDDKEIAVVAADAWLETPSDGPDDQVMNARLAMLLLEGVLKRDPDYTPAIHFYIHATEWARTPGLAEPYADRLERLAPKASHLVHMPSHTYFWVGRYQDAADANMRAVQLGIENAKALGLKMPDGIWGLPYHSHNVSFGLGGAIEAGDAKTALFLGRPLVERAQAQAEAPLYLEMMAARGYYAMALFADPAAVLALPRPKLPMVINEWHYARGEAFARNGNAAGVRAEAAAIRGLKATDAKDGLTAIAQGVVMLTRNVLIGRAAMIERRFDDAATAFRAAAEIEESPDFSASADPPEFYYPVRRDLAVALLVAGDPKGARVEAAAALASRPRDPGTLAVLERIKDAIR